MTPATPRGTEERPGGMAACSRSGNPRWWWHRRSCSAWAQRPSITLGGAIASPLAGLLIDNASPAAAVLTIGNLGIVMAGIAGRLARHGTRSSACSQRV